MNLSKNFSLDEMVSSDEARRRGIDNTPNASETEKLLYLCNYILQPIRDHFGPVRINSGFRSQELNQAIGGAAKSQHRYGEAADIDVPGVPLVVVYNFIRNHLAFGQVILEEPPGRSAWIHVSLPRIGGENFQALTWDGTTYRAYYG